MVGLRPSNEAQAAQCAQPIQFIDLRAQQARIREGLDRAIARVLEHGQYVMGPEVAELEGKLASFCGAKHAIACASGTDALVIAMMARGIGRGDAVLCPGFTFPATPEAIAVLGATPVFVDVDRNTFNLDPGAIEAGIAAARRAGFVPVGIIAVDLYGAPADYHAVNKLARENGLWVLADAAQSFGAACRGTCVGKLADITATSFFPAKPLGCYGDGGAIFTDDDELASVMRSIRVHGKGHDKYDIVRIGVNGRLDTIQAAVLLQKLTIFADEIEARNAVAARYSMALEGALAVPSLPEGSTSVWAQYTVRIGEGKRDAVAAYLAGAEIPAHIYYPRPLHRQRAYAHFPIAGGGLPVSERLSEIVLSLPMHPYLSKVDQDRITSAVLTALAHL